MNCFADKPKGCEALNKKVCDSCPFYKTTEDNKKSIQKAYRRIASLDKAQQLAIANKYFKHKMPWTETQEN
ncbi:MAG: hypothetical protein M0R40_10330 [Firmicutes bacterium]|nr:hypothetical protein [Bacillota bacterium]